MVAGKRGRPRKDPFPENSSNTETKPLRVVKTEPDEGHGAASSSRAAYVPAPDEVVCGYDEESAESDNEVIVDANQGTTVEQTTREIYEASPIERRLREKRSYNEGRWSSNELKSLYDGITTYGTTEDALQVIHMNFCPTRTVGQVIAKVEEIRALNAEYREDRIVTQTEQWQRTGYRYVRAVPQYVIQPEIDNWEAAIQRVNRQIRSHSDCAIRAAIENALQATPSDAENPSQFKVTDYRMGRGYGKEQSVSWQRLGAFFSGVVRHARPLPPLNALECAIALRVVDDVEEEVAQTLTDEHKAVIRGWLANIQMRHLRDFLPDTPYTPNNAARILLDPLRTRLWDNPPGASDIPSDQGEIHS